MHEKVGGSKNQKTAWRNLWTAPNARPFEGFPKIGLQGILMKPYIKVEQVLIFRSGGQKISQLKYISKHLLWKSNGWKLWFIQCVAIVPNLLIQNITEI